MISSTIIRYETPYSVYINGEFVFKSECPEFCVEQEFPDADFNGIEYDHVNKKVYVSLN